MAQRDGETRCLHGGPPLPLKRSRAQAQFDSVVVAGRILEAVYRQLECVHDTGLNEAGAAEGAERKGG